MHRPELFQTNQTELRSDENRGRRSISCELWTDVETTRWHKLMADMAEAAKKEANKNKKLQQLPHSERVSPRKVRKHHGTWRFESVSAQLTIRKPLYMHFGGL